MDHPTRIRTGTTADVERSQAGWSAPRLLRLGTVAALTAKVDNKGKNDGGRWPKRRT